MTNQPEMRIETPEDWWTGFERIIPSMTTLQQLVWDEEKWSESELRNIEKNHQQSDALLVVNTIWVAAPDKAYIHTWPDWHNLCDLCSESWVFEENENETISRNHE
jgi:hypothetical protein